MSARARAVVLPLIGLALVLAIWQGTVSLYHLQLVVLPRRGRWRSARRAPRHRGVLARRRREPLRVCRRLRDRAGARHPARHADGRMARIPPDVGAGDRTFRFIVPFAWIPLTILWFGTSYIGKILLVAYAVFFVMVVSTARAIVRVEPMLSRVGRRDGHGPVAARVTRAPARRGADHRQRRAGGGGDRLDRRGGRRIHRRERGTRLDDHQCRIVARDRDGDRGHGRHRALGAAVSALISWLSRTHLDYR